MLATSTQHPAISNYLGKYSLKQPLFSSPTTDIILSEDSETGEHFAIKVIKREEVEKAFKLAQKEAHAHARFSHKNILKLRDFDQTLQYVDLLDKRVYTAPYLVFDYASQGDFLRLVNEVGPLKCSVAKFLFRQVLEGLCYIHSNNFSHGDIKPENLLLDDDFNVLISDFEFSTSASVVRTIRGTQSFMAPEIHALRPYCGRKADLFAFGATMFCMVAGKAPFSKASPLDPSYRFIAVGDFKSFWEAHGKPVYGRGEFSKEFQELVSSLLSINPHDRPSAQSALRHSWFTGEITRPRRVKAHQ